MHRIVLAFLCLTACGSQDRADPKAEPPLTFDGGLVREASAKQAHGERLSWVLGCRGCHGKDLQGKPFYKSYASNLTRDIHVYSDAEFDAALRRGIRRGNRDLWSMPSELFHHLSDEDASALLAHLRTLRPAGKPTVIAQFDDEDRKALAAGKLKSAAQVLAEVKGTTPLDLGEQYKLGRYFTMVTCAECHGYKLEGNPEGSPDLVVAGAYSRDEFERLMTEGVPTGGRKLHPLMVSVSKNRFSKMTRHERDALYAYLKARAEQPQ